MNRRNWVRHAIALVYVLSVTYMIGRWAIHSAGLKRGYFAIGGEYLFIPLVAWAASRVINLFMDVLIEYSGRKSKKQNKTQYGKRALGQRPERPNG